MNWKNILRWIGVMPAAIGGILVGAITTSLLLTIQLWLMGSISNSGFVKIAGVVAYFAGGSLAVYWGSKTAPSHQKIVSAILTVILAIVSVIVFIFSIGNDNFNFFWEILRYGGFIFGAGYITHQFYKKGEGFKLF
jgi:peptidoglycan/LPS O-acetylase OafA/YrhL